MLERFSIRPISVLGASPFAGGDSWQCLRCRFDTSAAWSASSGAVQPHCAGSACADAIVVKVKSNRWQPADSTYLGGSGTETVGGIAVDASGSAYISGTTTSTDFKTTGRALRTNWIPTSKFQRPKPPCGEVEPGRHEVGVCNISRGT